MSNFLRRAILGKNNVKKSVEISTEEGHERRWPGGVVPYELENNLRKYRTLVAIIMSSFFKAETNKDICRTF